MASRRLPVRVRPAPPHAGIVQTVGLQSSKLRMRVRVPLPALVVRNRADRALPSRFSGEDRRLQHGARGFDSLSALRRITTGWSPWAL